MIESRKLTEILQNILRKEGIKENDLKKVENISLNKKMLNGKENDIELKEIEKIPNLKTITISNFEIDNQILEIINNHKKLKTLNLDGSKFEKDIINNINKNIKLSCKDTYNPIEE